MLKTKIALNFDEYPERFHQLLRDADIYDSSCSRAARVIFIDRNGGYFLKSAERGSLSREVELTEFFSKRGLSVPVLDYFSGERDYMLTPRA